MIVRRLNSWLCSRSYRLSHLPHTTFTVLSRCDDLLFIHKPSGIPFHSEEALEGIVSIVRSAFPKETLFPAHRLDKVTSGVMVFARNSDANRNISMLFADRKVQKLYIAISDMKPKKKQGTVKGDMSKARDGSYKLQRSTENPAITRFLSGRMTSVQPRYGFVLAPRTGKTHQLRVMMKSLGSPILGDLRYKGSPHERACLHAAGLAFNYKGIDHIVIDDHIDDASLNAWFLSDQCQMSIKKHLVTESGISPPEQ